MREKNRRKKSVFERLFFSARVLASEKTRIWKRPLCIYMLPKFARENAAKIAYMEKRPKLKNHETEKIDKTFFS